MSKKYKYLSYILSVYITFQVANLIIPGKLIGLYGIVVPASVFFFPFTYIFADILTEVYGYAESRKIIWQVFFAMAIGAIIFSITAYLPPADTFLHNEAFKKVFNFAPRVLFSSMIATWVGAILNDYVLAKMKVKSEGKHLWMRTVGSTVVGEGVNTIIFYTLAFIGVLSLSTLLKAIFWGWILKTGIEIIMTPATYYVVAKLKKLEGEDYYDRDTDFNPFKLV